MRLTPAFARDRISDVLSHPGGLNARVRLKHQIAALRAAGRQRDDQIVDVALNLNGKLIWPAIEQCAQFTALPDRNSGSADRLIAKIRSITEDLRSRPRS